MSYRRRKGSKARGRKHARTSASRARSVGQWTKTCLDGAAVWGAARGQSVSLAWADQGSREMRSAGMPRRTALRSKSSACLRRAS